jgi:glutamate dehydrogenase/leucine dehydrogenase
MSWDLQEVNSRLQTIMQRSFIPVLDVHLERKVSMRTAATMLAIQRVVEATKTRGLYP